MKKLEGQVAEVIKGIIHDGDTVIEVDGKKYYLSLLKNRKRQLQKMLKPIPN
ncbi:hypothetical protein NC797_11550 [Aquibacillus sp. 3ASR75-11]|uniref:Uncharacterized protein n=1 Tax=Terrihalobacillus insolitus TaxID=2950438 RepID=A0A9X4AP38_9BACI|nr:hypothetical protein [Terrihalobacillus insolitus]MDC3425140.1 hypothetical protein [Terrihalobacillus insolitus]